MTVCHIKDGKRQGVVENRRSTLKTDAMVAQIFSGFLGIPCKDMLQYTTPSQVCRRQAEIFCTMYTSQVNLMPICQRADQTAIWLPQATHHHGAEFPC